MKFEKIDPCTLPDWDEQIGCFPKATFFHTALWARVLMESYGFLPYYVIGREGSVIKSVLPCLETMDIFGRKKAVSLPFSDFCEPLFETGAEFQKVLAFISQKIRGNRWQSIELRGGGSLFPGEPCFEEIYTHDIDLARSENEIINSFRSSAQRNIRAAEKQGIVVSHENTLEALRAFCRLNCLTRREHGLPPQPWSFFRNLWSTVLQRDKGFITLASYKGVVIAANLYLIMGTKALYKYGASDRAYQQLRASNLVMWKGIKRCRKKGCLTLNLGRTESIHEGLLRYKRGFGCIETTVNYYRYDFLRHCFVGGSSKKLSGGFAMRTISKLPMPLLKLLGAVLYKYVG